VGGLNGKSGLSPQPLVSVCIANYNGMEVMDDCLRSVLAQHSDIPVEILVHDDASTDGSLARIRENCPDAVLIESDLIVGFCIANNRMVAGARWQFLIQFDDSERALC